MSPQARNWTTAIVSVGLLVVLAAVLGSLSGERRDDPFHGRASTFFTDQSGARALLLVMQRFLPAVEQWRLPLNRISDDEPAGTLIVAGPATPLSRSEAEQLDQWLERGGQLILASANGWPLTSRAATEKSANNETKKSSRRDSVKKETYLSRHAPGLAWSEQGELERVQIKGSSLPDGSLTVQTRRHFSSAREGNVLAKSEKGVLAIEIPIGKGRIVALPDPAIVSNRALRHADNAVWLVTLAARWPNGKVLFDEYHHGFGEQRSVAMLAWAFLKTPWGWVLLQVAAAGLLYVFGYRRRFGRISEPLPQARTSPLELVEARASLFQAAEARELAASLIVQNLSRQLAEVDGSAAGIGKPAGGKIGQAAEPVMRLRELSTKAAHGTRLTDDEFVELGRIAGEIEQGSLR